MSAGAHRTEKTVFAGFGGQGIISLGQIWVYCGMKEGREVSFFPFYGAEKRGGIARASCIVSDEPIANPIITRATSAVVMNRDSLPLGISVLGDGGLLLVNSSLVSDADIGQAAFPAGIRILRVPATERAEALGSARFANMVMLGALARATGALKLTAAESILKDFFPASKHSFIPVNLAAIRAGMDEPLRG